MKLEIAAMSYQMYPSISGGKQDPVREVVMKYIDYFYPDASGTSAVAIDNKIEQAMDLVKSHLMIAVREEVEVLKEKISELMDKINQLEVENTILKANMSQETLQQLQMQTQLQIAGNGTQAAITAAPPTQQQQPALPSSAQTQTNANPVATAVAAAVVATTNAVANDAAAVANAVAAASVAATTQANNSAATTTNGPMS